MGLSPNLFFRTRISELDDSSHPRHKKTERNIIEIEMDMVPMATGKKKKCSTTPIIYLLS